MIVSREINYIKRPIYLFFQQVAAFYEDNFPEVMKRILVVKGENMHHPLLFCKIFLVKKTIDSIALTGSLKCTSPSQISKLISCTP